MQATTGVFEFWRPAIESDLGGAGEMSDAGEVVMALYEQLAPVAAKANQPGLLDHIFGLHVKV